MRVTSVIRESKTAQIDLEIVECRIQGITISGDFFAYPEGAIELLEQALTGCNSLDCITQAFSKVEKSATLLGVSWDRLRRELTSIFETACASK